jgi:hypothetical protein
MEMSLRGLLPNLEKKDTIIYEQAQAVLNLSVAHSTNARTLDLSDFSGTPQIFARLIALVRFCSLSRPDSPTLEPTVRDLRSSYDDAP